MCVSYFLEKHRLSFTEMPCFRKTWRSGKHVLWNFARVTGSSYVSRTSWSGTMFWRAQRTGVPHGNLSSLDTGLASFQGRSRFPIHLRFGVRNQPEICGLGFGQCCTDSGDTLRGWMVMDLDASNRWLLRLLRLLRTRNSFVISVDMVWYDDMMIWYDVMWYDVIWYDMVSYDMICLNAVCCPMRTLRYWGRLRFPKDYPFRPPSILMVELLSGGVGQGFQIPIWSPTISKGAMKQMHYTWWNGSVLRFSVHFWNGSTVPRFHGSNCFIFAVRFGSVLNVTFHLFGVDMFRTIPL